MCVPMCVGAAGEGRAGRTLLDGEVELNGLEEQHHERRKRRSAHDRRQESHVGM